MNAVDYAVLGVLAISGLLAFLRGFVREVLGIAAWIGAVVIALAAEPTVRPHVRQYVGQWVTDPQLQSYTGFGAVFLVAVVVLLMISHWVGALVRQSVLGGVDRSLGLLFGLGRGAALLLAAYIGASWLVPLERWPEIVLRARSLQPVYQGAAWVAAMIPEPYRPMLHAPPPGKDPSAADLLHPVPSGRATGPTISPLAKPTARE